jgi:hypothetical protein
MRWASGLHESRMLESTFLGYRVQCGATVGARIHKQTTCLASASNQICLTKSSVVKVLGLRIARSAYARVDLHRPSKRSGVAVGYSSSQSNNKPCKCLLLQVQGGVEYDPTINTLWRKVAFTALMPKRVAMTICLALRVNE